jgi:hypothetical protein
MKKNIFQKYGYLWVTLVLFITSMGAHWTFAWYTYKQEQEEKNLPVDTKDYLNEVSRDTFENWQSEFLQLIWQVAGLSFLLSTGSPQSKEGDERVEEKIDFLLKKIAEKDGVAEIRRLESKYPKK